MVQLHDSDQDVPEISFDLDEIALGDKRHLLGLVLAFLSTLLIGSSFIVKKLGLIRLSSKVGSLRASQGGFGYLKDWMWWVGFLLMGLGELCNFAAYAFAPASLVTPLGALSVLVTALLARKFLGEKLGVLGFIGCINCILGSTTIVLHAPKEGQIKSLSQLATMLKQPSSIVYLTFVLLISCMLIFIFSPKYGDRNIFVHITICSLIGSLTVMSCKGIGLALTETIASPTNNLNFGLFWFLLLTTIATVAIQMNYLNKTLDVFDASLVTPIYYVMFTSLVLLSSSILFKEWQQIQLNDYLGSISGFGTVITGISLINFFKDTEVTRINIFKSSSFRRTRKEGANSYSSRSSKQRSINSNTSGNTMVKPPRKRRRRHLSKSIKRQDCARSSSSEGSDNEMFSLLKNEQETRHQLNC